MEPSESASSSNLSLAKPRPNSELNGQSPSHLKVQRSVSSNHKQRRYSEQGDAAFSYYPNKQDKWILGKCGFKTRWLYSCPNSQQFKLNDYLSGVCRGVVWFRAELQISCFVLIIQRYSVCCHVWRRKAANIWYFRLNKWLQRLFDYQNSFRWIY